MDKSIEKNIQEYFFDKLLETKPTWIDVKHLNIGSTLVDIEILKKFIYQLAKEQFKINKDPCDILLDKKNTICEFFKAVKNYVFYDLLNRDFSIDENVKIAEITAYTLLSRSKYEFASAFFILAGKI